MASSSRGTVVRPFEARDAAAVHRIWTDGFLEMSGDFTRSITGPAAAAVGVAALALSRSRLRGLAIAAAAAAAVPFLYRGGRRAIRRMCEEECATGNMSDIAATWHVPGFATFLVEVDARSGDVLGCIAVRRGSVRDVDAAPDAPLQAPDACSVWRVSVAVAARRRGVARSLMAAAERWAAENLKDVTRVELVTGSIGAKRFYERLGYTPQGARWVLHGVATPVLFEKRLQRYDVAPEPAASRP